MHSSTQYPRQARRTSTLLAAVLVLAAAPAFAGTVYVPAVTSTATDVTFTPQVILTEGTRSESLTPGDSIAASPGSDGRLGSSSLTVVSLKDDQRVSATLVARAANGEEIALPLPILTPAHATPGGAVATVEGLRRTAHGTSALHLANLAPASARCDIRVLEGIGDAELGTTEAELASLSTTSFDDVLATVGAFEIASARVEISCEAPFYAFATVHGRDADGNLAGETLVPIAGSAPEPVGLMAKSTAAREDLVGSCLGSLAQHCHHLPGAFFAPSQKNGNQKRAVFPVQRGDYRRVRLRMEVLYGGPNPRNRSGLQQVFWMAQNSRNVDLVGFTSVRKNNTALMQRAGIGTGPGNKSKVIQDTRLTVGQTYLMDYLYDAQAGAIVWNIIERPTGRLVASILDRPNVRSVRFADDGHMGVDVSMDGSNRKEPPSYRWVYSELVFEIFR